MVAKNLNTPTYVLAATASSSSVSLQPQDANASSVDVYNGGTAAVALVSGFGSAPTAVFPTSATVPIGCTVVAPGAIETISKNVGDNFISGITSTGTASVYIQPGSSGE